MDQLLRIPAQWPLLLFEPSHLYTSISSSFRC